PRGVSLGRPSGYGSRSLAGGGRGGGAGCVAGRWDRETVAVGLGWRGGRPLQPWSSGPATPVRPASSGRCSFRPGAHRARRTEGRSPRPRPARSRASNGPAGRAESGDPGGGEGLHARLTRVSTETIFRVLTNWNPFTREEKRTWPTKGCRWRRESAVGR